MFEHIRAGFVGALPGLTAYVAWLTRDYSRLGSSAAWQLSGPVKWFLLGGVLLGMFGGLSVVERWLEREQGEVFENTVFNGLFVVALIAVAAILFFSLK